MARQLRTMALTDIEPYATQRNEKPEKIQFHMEWYTIHGEFIRPLVLEVGGRRCERKKQAALLLEGNHRFRAAQALGLETVAVTVVNLW